MMKKKRIYISGKISGLAFDETYKSFDEDQKRLERIGFKVVNPMHFCKKEWSWIRCMFKCITLIPWCDCMYQRSDWKNSRGAKIEYNFAHSIWFRGNDFMNEKSLERIENTIEQDKQLYEKHNSPTETSDNVCEDGVSKICKKEMLMYLSVGDRFKFNIYDTEVYVVYEKHEALANAVTCVNENTLEPRDIITSWYVFVVD